MRDGARGREFHLHQGYASVLTPDVAFELVSKIKAATNCPCRCTRTVRPSIAQMTLLKSVEAGADIIDTCLSPFAEGTSQPCSESMAIALEGLGYDTGLDLAPME